MSIDKMTLNKSIVRSFLNMCVGHMVLQVPCIMESMILNQNSSLTHTKMGYERDEKLPYSNVTYTCTFSNNLNCCVPFLVGISFGMTTVPNQRHFLSLLKVRNLQTFMASKIIGQMMHVIYLMLKEWVSIKKIQSHPNLSEHKLRV